jgi:hypothetical protein
VAEAAGVDQTAVVISNIVDARRASSIKVDVTVKTTSAALASTISSNLSEEKLNAKLKGNGLEEASILRPASVNTISSQSAATTPAPPAAQDDSELTVSDSSAMIGAIMGALGAVTCVITAFCGYRLAAQKKPQQKVLPVTGSDDDTSHENDTGDTLQDETLPQGAQGAILEPGPATLEKGSGNGGAEWQRIDQSSDEEDKPAPPPLSEMRHEEDEPAPPHLPEARHQVEKRHGDSIVVHKHDNAISRPFFFKQDSGDDLGGEWARDGGDSPLASVSPMRGGLSPKRTSPNAHDRISKMRGSGLKTLRGEDRTLVQPSLVLPGARVPPTAPKEVAPIQSKHRLSALSTPLPPRKPPSLAPRAPTQGYASP